MKTAVVFYSYDGNCTFVAEQVRTRLNADLVRLETRDTKRRGGFAKYFWGGSQVFMRAKPALKPYEFDPAAYELIIIGGPVWAGAPAPPLQTFLSETKISGKKIALFVCHAGGKGKALGQFRALLDGNAIAGEADFINPLRQESGEVTRRIEDWLKLIGA
jgi:flavodoxin